MDQRYRERRRRHDTRLPQYMRLAFPDGTSLAINCDLLLYMLYSDQEERQFYNISIKRVDRHFSFTSIGSGEQLWYSIRITEEIDNSPTNLARLVDTYKIRSKLISVDCDEFSFAECRSINIDDIDKD